MRCGSCGVNVGAEFTFAIQNNQCPACGKKIMRQDKLVSYLSLRELLKEQIVVKGVDVDKLASSIVANFELRQIFKEAEKELQNVEEEGNIEVEEETLEEAFSKAIGEDEEDEGDAPVMHDGVKYEKVDKEKAKAALKKMRDEAFNDALNDRYDIDFNEDELPVPGNEPNYEKKIFSQQARSRNMIESGANSAFRRSE